LLPVNARVAVLAEQDQIVVAVPIFATQFEGCPRPAVARGCHVSYFPNDHDGIVFGRIGNQLDAAIRHRASAARASP
jgi:hypothetical protein